MSVIGNLIHLIMAGAGLLAAGNEDRSRHYLHWGGAGYFVLSCHRLLVDRLVAGGQVAGQGIGEWLVAAGLAMVLVAALTEATPRGRP